MRRLLATATMLFLGLPAAAMAATPKEDKFNPASEWTLHEWVPIHLGPIDMSINKAVAYLLLGGAIVGIPASVAVVYRVYTRTPA